MGAIQTKASCLVNVPFFLRRTRLREVDLAGRFRLRQGLWIEDWQTPPGQECSNGSLILLAVVLWRTSLYSAASRWPTAAGRTRLYYETLKNKNGTLFADS